MLSLLKHDCGRDCKITKNGPDREVTLVNDARLETVFDITQKGNNIMVRSDLGPEKEFESVAGLEDYLYRYVNSN